MSVCVYCGVDLPRYWPESLCGDCLDPDIYCARHGYEKPMSEYGVRYGGCDECEPPDPDYDRACDIAARRDPTHPDNLEAWRLKR